MTSAPRLSRRHPCRFSNGCISLSTKHQHLPFLYCWKNVKNYHYAKFQADPGMFSFQNWRGLNQPILRPLWLMTSAATDVISVPSVPFVQVLHQSPVTSPHKGQWRGALMLSLICTWRNGWENNHEAGDLRCHCTHWVTSGNRGTYYCFWSVSAAISAAAVLPTLFNFLGKPLKLISSNHTWLTYWCGKIFWHPFRWPSEAERNLPCTRGKVRTAHPIATKLGRYIPLIMVSTWLNFGEILQKKFFCEFLRKILNPFSPVELYICHFLRMVGPIDVKQKGNESTGCYAD